MDKKHFKESFISKTRLSVLKYAFALFLIFGVGFTLLRFPEVSGKAVTQSIYMCIKSVIPSLYPFMIVSSVMISVFSKNKKSKTLEKITYFLFRQPSVCLPVIFLSQIGGFPVGASLIKKLCDENKISKNQSHRLLLFCINPGPAFVMNYVGSSLLKNEKAGMIIYLSVVISSLTLGFFSRFFQSEDDFSSFNAATDKNSDKELSFTDIFVQGVKKSTVSIAEICGWVIVFSCIESIVDLLYISENSKVFVSALLEVTNACETLSKNYPLPLIAGAIGWSGLCVHFQVMNTLLKTRMKLKYFFVARVINCAAATVICSILFRLFPLSTQTAAGLNTHLKLSSASLPVSVGLIIMSLIILFGENLVFKKKSL